MQNNLPNCYPSKGSFQFTVFARFVAQAHIFFQLSSLSGPYSSTGACYFQSKITSIHKNYDIFEDKYFTTLILFPRQFIHVKHKLFIFYLFSKCIGMLFSSSKLSSSSTPSSFSE